MFHSDLRLEIAYLQAQLNYKRRKVAEGFRTKAPFPDLEKLYSEIKEVERKLQFCLEESNTQFEGE